MSRPNGRGENRLANIYLSPILNTPAKIVKAVKSDYIRIVYFDGQIADFKIKRWPSTMPVDFDKIMPAKNSPHLSEADLQNIDSRLNSCIRGPSYTAQYPTGYWGTDYSFPADNVIITTASCGGHGVRRSSNSYQHNSLRI